MLKYYITFIFLMIYFSYFVFYYFIFYKIWNVIILSWKYLFSKSYIFQGKFEKLHNYFWVRKIVWLIELFVTKVIHYFIKQILEFSDNILFLVSKN